MRGRPTLAVYIVIGFWLIILAYCSSGCTSANPIGPETSSAPIVPAQAMPTNNGLRWVCLDVLIPVQFKYLGGNAWQKIPEHHEQKCGWEE